MTTPYDEALRLFDEDAGYKAQALFLLRGHQKDSRMIRLLDVCRQSDKLAQARLAAHAYETDAGLADYLPPEWCTEVRALLGNWLKPAT